MSKRKLTRRQTWRIQKIQQERIRRQEKKASSQDDPLQQSQLGPEQQGLVIANYRANLIIEDASGHTFRCLARQNLGSIVCGDHVIWQQIKADEGVVTALLGRQSLLARPIRQGEAKPVAANIDQIFIVAAPEPSLQTLLIDRYLVATELADIPAVILINKIDLLTSHQQDQLENDLSIYPQMGYPIYFLSTKDGSGLTQLRRELTHRTSILAGQSGVGKSSIIKSLLPDIEIQIGQLSSSTKLGRHTTSASRLYHLATGGAIIDSPGVRDFGLWQIEKNKLTWGFREFRPFLGQCKFSNCRHLEEPGCALKEAVQNKLIAASRLENYHHIIRSTI